MRREEEGKHKFGEPGFANIGTHAHMYAQLERVLKEVGSCPIVSHLALHCPAHLPCPNPHAPPSILPPLAADLEW